MDRCGEEIGWRGFMVPALYEKLGLNKTLLISSLFWCCWHLPLLIGGGYMVGTPLWYQLSAFVLCIFPVGVMAGLQVKKAVAPDSLRQQNTMDRDCSADTKR